MLAQDSSIRPASSVTPCGPLAMVEMPALDDGNQRWPEGAPWRWGREEEGEGPARPFLAFRP